MEIDSFTTLHQKAVDPRRLTSPFINGHLVVEFLLRKLIQIYDPALTRQAVDLNHAGLISLNYEHGTISNTQKDVLVKINRMRNKFAHQLSYQPSLTELTELFKDCSGAFSDLSDGIAQGLDAINKVKSVDELDEWVIPELFIQIAYDLHEAYHSRGGDMEDF